MSKSLSHLTANNPSFCAVCHGKIGTPQAVILTKEESPREAQRVSALSAGSAVADGKAAASTARKSASDGHHDAVLRCAIFASQRAMRFSQSPFHPWDFACFATVIAS